MRTTNNWQHRGNQKAQDQGLSNTKARRARRHADQGQQTSTAHTLTTTNKSSRPLKHQSETCTLRCEPRRNGHTGVKEKLKPETTQTSRQEMWETPVRCTATAVALR
eukprot:829661-Pleurochrysis_carterae.AAC.1